MNIPKKCPSCGGKLLVMEFGCSECKTTINGSYELPVFASLDAEDENLLKVFLAARGSIKEMELQLGVSYPTVRAKVEKLVGRLGLGNLEAEARRRRLEVVSRLERGEIGADAAVALLRALEG